jgi:HPt (histidine-containing phosphotransfer) domain-containing protein
LDKISRKGKRKKAGKIPTSGKIKSSIPANRKREAVFDKDLIMARVYNDNELLKRVIGIFLDDCPKMLLEIRQAITRTDCKTLEHTSHAVKSKVGHFGAHAAFEAALRLEIIGREGDLIRAEEAYTALEKEIKRLKPALSALGK